MDNETEAVLKAEGYNVRSGSFGIPYRVLKGDGFLPVIMNGILPNHAEQEIVVIDLLPSRELHEPTGEKHTSHGEKDWWASCNKGVIDPRPRLMQTVRPDFDRIRSHGGVFIIFADKRDLQKISMAYRDEYKRFVEGPKLPFDNWCFLAVLNREIIEFVPEYGEEITVVEKEFLPGQLLAEHIHGAHFLCTLRPKYQESWITLARNKYGEVVAGAICPYEGVNSWIFIFPRLQDRPRFLSTMLREVLPDLSPHLFPDAEGARWVHRPEYELSSIMEVQHQILRIQEQTKQQVTSLEGDIEKGRAEKAYLYDLIRETGRPLVRSVKKALEVAGFRSVVDVDEQMKDETGPMREDLQINDNSPVLLVEVKGISGLPRDAEALQVWKYVAPRMKEWNRTEVQGLAIINHQRNLPALERDNKSPFREDILTNAKEQSFGLLTAWDLFRLIRSFLKHGWKHQHVKGLFYQTGRIDPVPHHYQYVGVVEKFWGKPGAVGVRIEVEGLRQGDRIAFELPVEFEEQIVESLQVDRNPVTHVEISNLAGIKTHLTGEQLRKGVRVFRAVE